MRKTYVRRSDVILLIELTDRIKKEAGTDLAEAVDIVHACLPAAMQEANFWMLPADGGSPYLSEKEPSELISSYVDSKWWRFRRVHLETWQQNGRVEAIHEMALLRGDAEEFVLRVREYVGDPTQVPASRHGYLDPSNPRYAPKLAAAVRAWQAVTDEGRTSVKRALEKWLREHAIEFGLANQAIEECSKVANWEPQGGAPKTPTA